MGQLKIIVEHGAARQSANHPTSLKGSPMPLLPLTRCNMVSTDGFVAAAKLFAMLERKMTRTSVLDFNVVDICAVLAHTTI